MDAPRRPARADSHRAPSRDPLAVDGEVAAFLDGVRAEYRREVPNDVAAAHLRAMLVTAAEAPHPTARQRWASRLRRAGAIGAVKVAVAATAAAAATGGGLAATGNLPDDVQRFVSDAANRVGIQVPAPAHDTPGERDDGMPGIGPGGVPEWSRSDADYADQLPGRAGDAPGHDRDEDGRPITPDAGPDDAPDDNRGDARPGDAGAPADPGKPSEPGRPEDVPAGDAGRSGAAGTPQGGDEAGTGEAPATVDERPEREDPDGRSEASPGRPADPGAERQSDDDRSPGRPGADD